MHMKKIAASLFVGVTLLSLSACGKDARKDFSEALFPSATENKFNAGEFELNMKKFDIGTSPELAKYKEIFSKLGDIEVTGTYAVDQKEKSFQTAFNIQAFGKKIPIDVVGNTKNVYMSTDVLATLARSAKSFGLPITFSDADLKKISGKYIDVSESQSTKSSAAATNLFKPSNNKKQTKELRELVQSFDKDSFKEEDGKLSHTFTKKELFQLMEISQKDTLKGKSAEDKKAIKQSLNNAKKTMQQANVKTVIDKKKHSVDMTVDLKMKDEKNSKNTLSIAADVAVKQQKKKKTITLPATNERLSEQELQTIIQNAYMSSQSGSAYGSTNQMSDAQLDSYIKQIKGIAGLTKAQADSARQSIEPYLTAAQKARLDKAIEEALAKSSNL